VGSRTRAVQQSPLTVAHSRSSAPPPRHRRSSRDVLGASAGRPHAVGPVVFHEPVRCPRASSGRAPVNPPACPETYGVEWRRWGWEPRIVVPAGTEAEIERPAWLTLLTMLVALIHTASGATRPGRPRDRLDPATAQLGRLRPQHQTTLPLVQIRTQHLVSPRRGLPDLTVTCHRTDGKSPDPKTCVTSSRVPTCPNHPATSTSPPPVADPARRPRRPRSNTTAPGPNRRLPWSTPQSAMIVCLTSAEVRSVWRFRSTTWTETSTLGPRSACR